MKPSEDQILRETRLRFQKLSNGNDIQYRCCILCLISTRESDQLRSEIGKVVYLQGYPYQLNYSVKTAFKNRKAYQKT